MKVLPEPVVANACIWLSTRWLCSVWNKFQWTLYAHYRPYIFIRENWCDLIMYKNLLLKSRKSGTPQFELGFHYKKTFLTNILWGISIHYHWAYVNGGRFWFSVQKFSSGNITTNDRSFDYPIIYIHNVILFVDATTMLDTTMLIL